MAYLVSVLGGSKAEVHPWGLFSKSPEPVVKLQSGCFEKAYLLTCL